MVAEAAIPSSGGQDRLEKAGERERERTESWQLEGAKQEYKLAQRCDFRLDNHVR